MVAAPVSTGAFVYLDMDIKLIAQSWKRAVFEREVSQELFEKRLEICDKCKFKRQLTPAGQVIISVVNQKANLFYCGSCNCPLEAKLRHLDSYCPEKFWGKVVDANY